MLNEDSRVDYQRHCQQDLIIRTSTEDVVKSSEEKHGAEVVKGTNGLTTQLWNIYSKKDVFAGIEKTKCNF